MSSLLLRECESERQRQGAGGTGRTGEGEPGTGETMSGLACTAPCITDTQEERPDDRRMHHAQTHIQLQREHTNPQTHHTAPQTSGRPRDTRAHTQVRPRATRTPRTGTRAGPLRPAGGRWPRSPGMFIYSFVSMNVCTRLLPPPGASAAAFVLGAGHSPGPASGFLGRCRGRRGLQS